MEIPKNKPFKSRILMFLSLGIIIGLFILLFNYSKPSGILADTVGERAQTVNVDAIKTTIVKRASFSHQITTYGLLKPSMEFVLLSQVSGIISQLHFKPGSKLNAHQPVISLVNPEVTRNLANAKFELQAATARYELAIADIGEQEFKLMSEEKLALADFEILETELAARKSLADRKIISELDFAKVKLELKKAKLRLQLSKQRLSNFVNNRNAKLKAIDFELDNVKRHLIDKQTDVDNLQVSVTSAGVLQNLENSIKLGAWINKGNKMGLVADTRQLYAQLEVNAADVSQLNIGMQVAINIKGKQVKGSITRIAPNVVNNRVTVDASIDGSLPTTARPEVEVNATIFVKDIGNTLIIQRPLNLTQRVEISLYVKVMERDYYEQRVVKTGAWSNQHIQVLAGIKEDDVVVISNTIGWHDKVKSNGS